MLALLRHRWRRKRDARQVLRATVDQPDHILRGIGLDRDRIGPTLARRLLIRRY